MASTAPAVGSTLQVEPVSIDVAHGNRSETITLRNGGTDVLKAQIRIFRWVQEKGRDRLVETRDVVVSPPFASIPPDKNHVVRVVRVGKGPVSKEESYRVLIDQLPTMADRNARAVDFVFRQSIPVFFSAQKQKPSQLSWAIYKKKTDLIVVAQNSGDERARISKIELTLPNGQSVTFGDGLVGYVLGRSSVVWTKRSAAKGTKDGWPIKIKANGYGSTIQSKASLKTAK
ncbi:fimbrial biogenesis chaperone [Zhengella mangrovi]|nr:fimbria/pilus periplasmic chaperone [Zhengella mangrovi]